MDSVFQKLHRTGLPYIIPRIFAGNRRGNK